MKMYLIENQLINLEAIINVHRMYAGSVRVNFSSGTSLDFGMTPVESTPGAYDTREADALWKLLENMAVNGATAAATNATLTSIAANVKGS